MNTSSLEVSPEFLTGVLRKSGCLDRGEVTRVEVRLTKKLHVSVVSRLELEYSPNATQSAPRKLFLKISSRSLSKEIPATVNAEIEFYNGIASKMDDPAFIRCYHAGFSSEYGEDLLLMEDLSETHAQPASPAPPSKEQSEAAVECLARLHAFWWEHSELGHGIGSLFDENKLNDFLHRMEKNVIGFIDFLGDSLSEERRRIYDLMLASKRTIWGRLKDVKGLTVTHGDAHWWNFLYPLDAEKDTVRVFDWQLWHIDLGARDLAFLIALGGFSARRPEIEPYLTRRYYNTLCSHGVSNLTWDDFWSDYRFSAIRNLNVPAIQWSQRRGAALWSSSLERAMSSFEDLRCSELIRN